MALALLAEGFAVTAMGRSPDAMQALVDEVRLRGFADRLLPETGDVTVEDDAERVVQRTIARFSHVDGLVNNAGAEYSANLAPRFFDIPVERWRQIMETNVNGPFIMARAVAPAMLSRGWGRIVNHLTGRASITRPGFTPYGPSKAALEAATAAWARELYGTGITVNGILPGGPVRTRRILPGEVPDPSMFISEAVMAKPIVWLLSSASDGITGRRITANRWNAGASIDENLRTASEPVGWES